MAIKRKRIKLIRRIIIGSAAVFLLLVVIPGGYYLYLLVVPQPRPINPLSSVIRLNSVSKADKNLQILKKQLHDRKIEYDKIDASGSGFTVTLNDGAVVVLSDQKDIGLQISSLQFILSRLTMEGRQFKKLDLQYDKPVIILKN